MPHVIAHVCQLFLFLLDPSIKKRPHLTISTILIYDTILTMLLWYDFRIYLYNSIWNIIIPRGVSYAYIPMMMQLAFKVDLQIHFQNWGVHAWPLPFVESKVCAPLSKKNSWSLPGAYHFITVVQTVLCWCIVVGNGPCCIATHDITSI